MNWGDKRCRWVEVKPGDTYGNLVVLRETDRGDDNFRRILCFCLLCKTEKIVRLALLRNGRAKSCGCGRIKHGCSRIEMPEYWVWSHMRDRCTNPNNTKYHIYGGRGISVCKEWDDFAIFLSDVGRRPSENHSLDRYPDNNGDYEKGNVRWATDLEQARNRNTTKMVTFNGEERPLSEWAEILGIKYSTLAIRLYRGWSAERAFTTKTGKYSKGESLCNRVEG
jgi:hypothetical protein